MALQFDDTAVQAILQGRRVIGRVPFPGGKGIELGVRLLSDRDIDLARFEAQMYLESQCKKVALTLVEFVNVDPESLEREHQRQVILRAFVDPESPRERPSQFFSTIEQVRSLDSVLVRQFWELYVDWQDTVNPRFKLTEQEVESLVATLKDEQSTRLVLAPFERSTLTSLVRFLASRLVTSQTGSVSTLPS
jgi:hypothetical protein